ncbi:Mu transposase C-terminal domain-containing protein [Paraburkholderia sp. EG287B]|uniref:Mu transposase C-terminal domain-containing protein n=1 Tax=Paraburkholderia sp. EG287B TaxID=3237010 RepID=UPI0034D38D9D
MEKPDYVVMVQQSNLASHDEAKAVFDGGEREVWAARRLPYRMARSSYGRLRRVRDEGYVVVDNLAYFSEYLKRFRGQTVRVFADLIHPGLVYICARKTLGWIVARCVYADFFARYPRRELLNVLAELKLGRLRGVRNPVLIANVLAEKMLELEGDPARRDHVARLFDRVHRLQHRAPPLLKASRIHTTTSMCRPAVARVLRPSKPPARLAE